MAIIAICHDSPDAPQLRKQYLQAHFDYIESILDQVYVAGPTSVATDNKLESNEPPYNGSCFIYASDQFSKVQKLFNDDPYSIHGVYQDVVFSHFLPAAGEWIGGKIW